MRCFNDYVELIKKIHSIKSDRKVAELINISQASIFAMVKGHSLPTDRNMIKLAKLAGIEETTALIELNLWRSRNDKAVYFEWLNIAKKLGMNID